MRLLVLDAALGPCSVALVADGMCSDIRHGGDSRTATVSLPALVDGLLADQDASFDAVAVTVGPGSFTGLRGALALAHGLALGAGVPVVGVTVAEALLAIGSLPADRAAWVALDSRRAGRVFLDIGDGMAAVTMDALPRPADPVSVFGDAAPPVVEALRQAGGDAICVGDGRVDAVAVGRVALRRLAGNMAPCEGQPLYVEPPEARPAAHQRPAPV